jgi:hypothetical protein
MRTITIFILGICALFSVIKGEYALACFWELGVCAILLEKISNQLAAAQEKGPT